MGPSSASVRTMATPVFIATSARAAACEVRNSAMAAFLLSSANALARVPES